MSESYSFRFADKDLNQRLVALLKRERVEHFVDAEGAVHYAKADEETVGNELIRTLRNRIFPSWQVLSCPRSWADRYKAYMDAHGVPFCEEWINHQLCFLIPRKYRPHSWKLPDESVPHPASATPAALS